jgi:hypothetical protein
MVGNWWAGEHTVAKHLYAAFFTRFIRAHAVCRDKGEVA